MDVAGAEVSSARVDDVHVEGLAAGWGLARELAALVRAPRVGEAEAAGAGGEVYPGSRPARRPTPARRPRRMPPTTTFGREIRARWFDPARTRSTRAPTRATRPGGGRRAGDIARGGRRARAETSGHGARGGSLRDAHARSSDARRAGPKIGIRWNSAPRAGVSTHRQFGMAPRGDGVAASVSAAFDAVRRAAWPHSRPGASLGERLASARLAGGASSSSSSHANLPSSPGGRTGGRFAPDASEVVDVDAARARREFADGGPAVCRLTSPTGAHGVFATWQPPTPSSRVARLRPHPRAGNSRRARGHRGRARRGTHRRELPRPRATRPGCPHRRPLRERPARPLATPPSRRRRRRLLRVQPRLRGGRVRRAGADPLQPRRVRRRHLRRAMHTPGTKPPPTERKQLDIAPPRRHVGHIPARGRGRGRGRGRVFVRAVHASGFTLAAASGRHGVRVAPRGLFRGPNRRARAEKTSRGRTARRASTVRATRHARRGVRV